MEEEIGVGSRRNNIILLIYIEGSNIITEVWLLAHRAVDVAGKCVATCWIEAFDPVILTKVLSLKDNERIFSITPLGYPREGFAKKHHKKRKQLDEIFRRL
jgi:nitroreductase